MSTIKLPIALCAMLSIGIFAYFFNSQYTSRNLGQNSSGEPVAEKTKTFIESGPSVLAAYKDDETSNRLEKQIETLKRNLAALQKQQNQVQNVLNQNQFNASQQEENTETTPEMAYQLEEQIELRKAKYEAELMTEPVDVEWANETVSKIEQTLAGEVFKGLDLVEANCGSTLCQLQISANDNMPIEESIRRLSVDRPWDGPTFYTADSQGNLKMFFARSGYELPEIQ